MDPISSNLLAQVQKHSQSAQKLSDLLREAIQREQREREYHFHAASQQCQQQTKTRENEAKDRIAKWKLDFEQQLQKRCRRMRRQRNLIDRLTLRQNIQRLKSGDFGAVHHASSPNSDSLRRRRYGIAVGENGKERLVLQRDNKQRQLVAVEDTFDTLRSWHANSGQHGLCKNLIYAEARQVFANIGRCVLRDFLRGCPECANPSPLQ